MDFRPDDAESAAAAAARAFARERLAPGARERDRSGRFPEDLVREMAGLGLLGVTVPEELGGAGAGAVAYALAMMELAAADCSATVTASVTNMVNEIIARWGTEEQRRRCCPRLCSGEWLAGAFGLSEPQSGSDAAGLRTRAERRGDGWVLSGQKQWITSGDVAGVVVVWARTGAGQGARPEISAFLVEQGTPGLTVGKHEAKMGQRASPTVPLLLEDCAVPTSAMLGRQGDGLRLAFAALDGGRIGIAAQAVGLMTAALEASVRYARERKTFGRPIAEHQAIAFMLADMATERDAARLLVLRAAALKQAGRPFTRQASMAKLFASEAAQRAASRAVQIHGGYGYTDEFPVERLLRDARVQTLYEGTSEIQRLVISREVLREGR
jgi:alkylation response protein AidB-like acyl-CoA dehydrogenase